MDCQQRMLSRRWLAKPGQICGNHKAVLAICPGLSSDLVRTADRRSQSASNGPAVRQAVQASRQTRLASRHVGRVGRQAVPASRQTRLSFSVSQILPSRQLAADLI
jgi:hypothetical protein